MNEDIAVLLGKYFSGQVTGVEAATVKAWIAASERNEADFALLQKLWDKAAEQPVMSFDTEKALQTVHAKLQPATRPGSTGRLITLRRAIAIAASMLIFFASWWLWDNNNSSKYRTELATTDVKEIQLEDGSRIFLRKGARLQFPDKFANNNRMVTLTGEAFFEVTPDAAKPFIISALQTTIQVVGTSFLVNTDTGKTILVVKTGRVRFNSTGNTNNQVMVTAGERAEFAHNNITKAGNTDENFMAWQSKQLVFNKTPLQQVVATLGNYYQVNIDLKKEDSAQLAAAVVTTRFNDQSLSSVLNELTIITSYRIRKVNDNNYEISVK